MQVALAQGWLSLIIFSLALFPAGSEEMSDTLERDIPASSEFRFFTQTFSSLHTVHPRVVANFAPFLLCFRALSGMTMIGMAAVAPRVAVDGQANSSAAGRQGNERPRRVASLFRSSATMDACHRAVGLSDASIVPHILLASSRP